MMTLKIDRLIQKIRRLHPATVLALSFMLAIAAGAGLLLLPAATTTGNIAPIDALFTATSAVCVTGLIVMDTGSYFTMFGQGVILTLIQIGGLGVMTISVTIFRLLGKNISFRQRLIMQDIFTHTPQENILHLVRSIVVYTATIESLGAGLLFIHWIKEYPAGKALYIALFHSISAFCNAGFSTFSSSMMNYHGDLLLNLAMCSLIVLGGIGFPVLHELFHAAVNHRTKRFRFSAHTKTVLITTVVLITAGASAFGFLERNSILQDASFMDGLLISLFQSITCRTAGFNTVDTGALSSCTLSVMLFLMFFGASPGSCGGGVKTTTLALISAFAWSRIKRNYRVNMFKKSVPSETVTKSTSLILIASGLIALVFFLVLLSVPNSAGDSAASRDPFLLYLFETISAFGTVGLSMGATPTLTGLGKFWIVLMMLIGRVGVLTFSYIITGASATKGIEYAEENIMIG